MPWAFYTDPALTTLAESLSVTTLLSGDPVNQLVYFGNPTAGVTLEPASGANVTVSVVDASVGGGLPSTAVRLAASEAGLVSATPGTALSLGASLTAGPAGSVPVWLQVSPGAADAGSYSDLSLTTNDVIEVPV